MMIPNSPAPRDLSIRTSAAPQVPVQGEPKDSLISSYIPQQDMKKAMLAMIESATSEITVSNFLGEDPEIRAKLLQREAEGIKVVDMASLNAAAPTPQVPELGFLFGDGQMHRKGSVPG